MHTVELIRGLKGLKPEHRGSVATIGAFDGVHLGHQRLIERLKSAARETGLPSTVILFEPQPNEFFNRDGAPARLMRLREKVNALAECQVDRVLCLKFDHSLSDLTAKEFVQVVLVDGLAIKHLIVGDDFHFGCDRTGDYGFLTQSGKAFDFTVEDTQSLISEGVRVSSTYIRELLANSELAEAEALLGRPYSSTGRVVYGRQLGRTLGFPTMNIHLGRLHVPISGVYAVSVVLAGHTYCGVANVGVRPTVNQLAKPILEVHLFDASINAYGKCVRVTYLHKLRSEQVFSGVEELKVQIGKDVKQARAFFKAR